jgi:hypothetical protein
MIVGMRDLLALHVAPSADVVVRRAGGESILLDFRRETYYALSEVAARVWDCLCEHGHAERAIDVLLAEYDIDEVTLRRDVSQLVAQWVELGVITVSETSWGDGDDETR